MKTIFIGGTDTGVGKTMVCACLARFFSLGGYKVGIQKWVSTGNAHESEDIEFCLAAMGIKKEELPNFSCAAPYNFAFPASPHLAAELEGREIDIEKIKEAYGAADRASEILLVEGVGGLLVPLTRDILLIDLVRELSLPVLLVSRTRLGTINHTLLTLEALKMRNIPVTGLVFNDLEDENECIVADNIKTIARIGGVETLGRLPRGAFKEVFQAFQPVGARIMEKMGV